MIWRTAITKGPSHLSAQTSLFEGQHASRRALQPPHPAAGQLELGAPEAVAEVEGPEAPGPRPGFQELRKLPQAPRPGPQGAALGRFE